MTDPAYAEDRAALVEAIRLKLQEYRDGGGPDTWQATHLARAIAAVRGSTPVSGLMLAATLLDQADTPPGSRDENYAPVPATPPDTLDELLAGL